MLKTGLCSITFRELTAEQIIDLAVKAELEGIEWGGDIHVPTGDFTRASEVSKMTERASISIVAYGSYYRVGCKNKSSFEEILKTAVKLNAPAIRVWAGNRGSKDADETYWEAVISDSRKIAAQAEEKRITVNYEYHGGTLTDTKESASRLMKEVGHSNVGLYWQPAVGEDLNNRIDSIQKIHHWLAHVHVFHWEGTKRLPLAEGKQEWIGYLQDLKKAADERYMMLEFVKDDNQEQFLKDAETLKHLIKVTKV